MSALSNWEARQEMGYSERFDRLEAEQMQFDTEINNVVSDIELGRDNVVSEVCELLNTFDMHNAMMIIARNLTEQYAKDDTPSERLLRALIDGAIVDYAERKI